MKKLLFVLLGLLALTSCHDKEEAQPATEEQLKELTGHWYAELPLSGETENWRTEEEGDMTTYDKIGALIYLNGAATDACYWGYLYLQNGDMVNYDGLHHRDQEANFAFTMDSEGNITTSSNLPDAPQVSNMHYDSTQKVITADVTFKGRSLSVASASPSHLFLTQISRRPSMSSIRSLRKRVSSVELQVTEAVKIPTSQMTTPMNHQGQSVLIIKRINKYENKENYHPCNCPHVIMARSLGRRSAALQCRKRQ